MRNRFAFLKSPTLCRPYGARISDDRISTNMPRLRRWKRALTPLHRATSDGAASHFGNLFLLVLEKLNHAFRDVRHLAGGPIKHLLVRIDDDIISPLHILPDDALDRIRFAQFRGF